LILSMVNAKNGLLICPTIPIDEYLLSGVTYFPKYQFLNLVLIPAREIKSLFSFHFYV
jgi:hypothetical protein